MRISFTVLGDPKAQKRHRSARVGKFIKMYDPSSKDKDDFLWLAHQNAPTTPSTLPINLFIKFYFQRPKSHYKTGKLSNELKPTAAIMHSSKPDIDNLTKFCMDAMNHIYYKDDGQICMLKVTKLYSDHPRTEIEIEEF